MTKIIALDNGHGMDTPGKRTPRFTDGTKSARTGKDFMHEWEFNRATVQLLAVELTRCGFQVVEVSPSEVDASIGTRGRRAVAAGADFFLSVHANALTGAWGAAQGIETLTDGYGESLRIGELLQEELVTATGRTDRGMKDGKWLGVLKATRRRMPGALVECGFMDNMTEAKLLLSDAYRETCAVAMAKALCRAYGLTYVPKVKVDKEDEPMTAAERKAFEALEKRVEELEQQVDVPKWFSTEFANDGVLSLIDTKSGSLDFWRSLAVSLRAQGKGNGKRK